MNAARGGRSSGHAPHPPAHAAGAPGEVRIIGGQWRRSRLPVANRPGLRPTPDRVRETLFNWLGQDLTGWHCLDAFAGSGALGFEAASRHAAEVLLVEQDRAVAAQLKANAGRLKAGNLRVQAGDGLLALAQPPAGRPEGWDLVFLDPPFAAGLESQALALAAGVLAPEGLVYLESGQRQDATALAAQGWQLLRNLRAGAVHAHLLQRGAAHDTTVQP
ncbi:16S rRNA (guanine(966)-N(2))-methyltransferase RsmD [Corticibacter populi]|uniref:16S rRNA (Guanine(966)-N(2))-methyltransferase RsmD n=1 Tax=Corticibacter populi TaxID=1550736 RepID=A0A3M6QSB1_9BURK|nr:16S rRNA (guanine(966)-N(2))-methyltransferase RsmD [Corticibacter populi]RMX05930.1 16S rRNA (guanine(966)-N(2))-methyltransferase RsmD [Corticibacter populi]RZS30746.1 16S rRNA (guanine(966)-N(2))-methyltransferase RsmD [Corticibacter populi]